MSNFSTVCIDANLVVKLLGPSKSPVILDQWDQWIASQTRIVAPQLIRYEVTNALYQMIRHQAIDKDDADVALRAMTKLPIIVYQEESLHQAALDTSVRFVIRAAYDAHYLALAEYLNCNM